MRNCIILLFSLFLLASCAPLSFPECDELLENQRVACYGEKAAEHDDVRICDMFTEYARDDCLATAAGQLGDATLCREVIESKNYRVKCLLEVAETNQDMSLCEELQGMSVDARIVDDCYIWFVKQSGDESLCEKVEVKQEDCVAHARFVSQQKGSS